MSKPLVLAGTTLLVGLLCGWLWPAITPLPGYTVQVDGGAHTTERGLTEFIIGDVTYTAIGLVIGIGLGLVSWRAYGRSLGWPVVPIGLGAALLAGTICWFVGGRVGPHNFTQRLAAAHPGDLVVIDLQLRSAVAVVAWALGACIPLLAITTLARDPDDGEPFHLPWSDRRSDLGSPADAGEPATGDGDEVVGGEPDLQATTAGRDHDGAERGS